MEALASKLILVTEMKLNITVRLFMLMTIRMELRFSLRIAVISKNAKGYL